MTGRYRGSCYKLEELGLYDTENCCGSCHYDDPVYGDEMMEIDFDNGDYLSVCCGSIKIDIDPEELLKRLDALDAK